ncbi:MAG: N-acetylglutaminylglutamine amidotransferase [Gammaproteobacteria bacterium]|nr:N-acetylglutaminylglutamine amidotransferase [Gammaproteobacteria bacterium]
MCGICGEFRFDGAPGDVAAVERMSRVLARRGPDDTGAYTDGSLAFGHRRLAIIDLSERSHQPMVDTELGLALVFNGTIYNYPELRSELQGAGYRFFSEGDTEVIIKAFHRWGEHCVERLHGMFAFALWDKRQRQLFLARDRLGIKPLYFSHTDSHFRFASSVPALLAAGDVDTRIDPVGLHHQLTLHAVVPAPATILRGARKLAPASTLTVTGAARTRHRSYWQLRATRPAASPSEDEWVEEVHATLRDAVERRLRIADVPVGVLLSGGLDSSLLVGLLAEAGADRLHTFSIGFEDVAQEVGNEFEYSDQVVERFSTAHHKFHVPNSEVLERLPEAIQHMAEPMVGQDAVAFYLLAERVSKSIKVVQSGQGADEVFGGYFWYPRMQAESGSFLERFRKHYFDRDHQEYLETVTTPYYGDDYTAALVEERLSQPDADSFMDQVLRMDATMLIVDDPVKRVDNMTMAWGLEARVPFLDQQVVELAARMPPELKLKGGGKHVLKRIARGLIPDAVIDRPKGYFPVPALKFIRGPFLEFMRTVLTSETCRRRRLFNGDYVKKILSDPEAFFTRIQGSKVWHLALLEHWLQTHVDGSGVKTP